MEAFQLTFDILSCCGVWRPIHYSTKLHNLIYDLYSIFFIPLPYAMATFLVSRLFLEYIDPDEIAEALFLSLTTIGCCAKSINLLFGRKSVVKLISMLTSEDATPRNNAEREIWNEYDKVIRYSTIICAIFVQSSVVIWIIVPFFQTKENRGLPFSIWLPYDLKPEYMFWITYVIESITITLGAFVNIVVDTAISGFMVAICGQFDLLSYRLHSIPEHIESVRETSKLSESEIETLEEELLGRSIKNHLFIFEFAETLSKAFRCTILVQFITSSIIISICVYQLSVMEVKTMEFFSKVLYLMCMLIEFFIYCWFGNELIHRSQNFGDSVLKINWTSLSVKFDKQLLIMTLRATKPIVVSCGHFIVLSLDSFTKILKASYTAFNVLRTSSIT